MRKLTLLLVLLMIMAGSLFAAPKSVIVSSPNGNLKATVELSDKIKYSVNFQNKPVIIPSAISLQLNNGKFLGLDPVISNSKTKSVHRLIDNVINGRRKSIKDEYNETRINLKGNYSIVFRVYNEGVAYRFVTNLPGTITIKDEEASFNFANDYSMYYIAKVQYDNSGEGSYLYQKISQMPDSVYSLAPLIVSIDNGPKVAITEADLFDYAGFNLKRNSVVKAGLKGSFAPDVLEEEGNVWVYKIKKRKDYIAETSGKREFPWRVIVVAENDIDLTNCDIVYKLSKPSDYTRDLSWIKNGKSAWDWWVDWNITGVDFKGEQGSFEYYKYLIDFAVANKLEFVEVSVGWMDDQDILKVNPKIRMPELMAYAKSKNIGIMVWAVAHRLERQFNDAFDLYSKLGVAGVKVDFLDADHQGRVNFYEKIAKECMKRKLMVYYHGAYKPTGLERTYPCIINYEGVQANEYNKWSKEVTPRHNINVAFIRNLAGPMDMNLGPMRNAQPEVFAINYIYPMSQGTRCHQLAMYITYFAPFNMVADAPNEYIADKHCIELIASIPSQWDETKPIAGKIGEYILMAKRNKNNWYVSGMNSETPRTGKIKLDFLEEGEYTGTLFKDGVNAAKVGTDYKIASFNVNKASVIDYEMIQGGGFVLKLIKKK